jgi:L-asparaginase
MDQRYIALLGTGGTISTTSDGEDGRSQPALSGSDLAALVDVPGIRVRSREIAQVPSWTLDVAAMTRIALAGRDAAAEPDVDGVVVTHGTTTLEYTAFLTHLFHAGAVPIVFTGAMRRADEPHPDGPGNLRDAVRFAASAEARRVGVAVVFAGRVIAARSAWKARRLDADAFVDLEGDLGSVSSDTITLGRRPTPGPGLSGRIEPAVAFVKAVPGLDEAVVDAAAAGARGLVVEALPGAGGIPPTMRAAVVRAAERMPVVVAPRSPWGRIPATPTGGTGEPLRDAALLSPGTFSAEQAWLLLMAALGEAPGAADARRIFESVATADGASAQTDRG